MRKLKPIERTATEDWALSELRSAIMSGQLAPGSRLRQEDLAAKLGVSRMPVRQALLGLEREGLVQTDRWRGTVVSPIDPDLVRDMYAFRAVVERYVAETLASRKDFDSSPIREVVAAARKAISGGDVNRAIELDLQFHTLLYDSVGNQVLSSVMRGQWSHIRRVMAVTLTVPKMRQRVWDEHSAILDAIDARDSKRAAAHAEAHMKAASGLMLIELTAGEIATGDDRARPGGKRAKAAPAKRRSGQRA